MDSRPHELNPTATWSTGTESAVAATAGLEAIARDRLSAASNDLAGIATSALPDVQIRLLDVIADLDDLGQELRRLIIVLRNGWYD